MVEKIDMSLDDIIKTNKRGRGTGNRGRRGRGRGFQTQRSPGLVSRGRIQKRRGSNRGGYGSYARVYIVLYVTQFFLCFLTLRVVKCNESLKDVFFISEYIPVLFFFFAIFMLKNLREQNHIV